MRALSDWLNARGLGALHSVLEAQQIDLDVLPELTEDDLKDLGIALGPRRRLLKAIADARAQPSPALPAGAEPVVDSAERRQLSVLFVDLVGSTALSQRRDPEEMRQIVRRYQNAVSGEVARFDGYLAKFMGDGVLAYFGWPKAHEDEAERAVRAAMAAVAAVGELRTGDGVGLAARAGIATGLVVVGDLIGHGAAQEAAVVGDTPNIAARLQDLAQPGQVVIADSTQKLVRSSFDLMPLGLRSLKGLDLPLAAFAVERQRSSDSRFEARAGYQLRPMVGRDQELALLRERWAEVQGGEGQCLLLVGEAGIGKSRITRALLDVVAKSESAILRFQCSPYHLDSALWPVIQQLTVAIGMEAADSPATRLDKIEAFVRPRAAHIESALPLVASLLGVPYDNRYGPLNLSPQVQRNRTLAALVEQFSGLARSRPVLVVMEDMHWTDPSTLEFIHVVLDRIGDHRILLLLTSRPDGQPVLAGHPQVTRLVLNRLGRAAVEAMTAAIEGSDTLPDAVRREILARTDGVPLFVEELTRALVELAGQPQEGAAGADRAETNLSVPATLHDSLMSRLDRLPEVKRVAQVAACIGRNFDYRTLAAVARMDDGELNAALDRLVEAELVFRRGVPPDSAYTFKHALVRDAAANSLLRSEFRRINGGIVAAFETLTARPPPELIGWHAELAGLDRKAVDHLLQAGDRAIERYANHEAINHLERALRLIAALPESAERGALELRALAMVGVPRIALHGYASAEVEATYRRTVELAERVGDTGQLFQGLRGLWNCIYDRAEIVNAHEVAQRLCALALDHPAAEAPGLAYRALGAACFSLGRFQEAIDAFETGVGACAGLPVDAGLREHGESPLVINGVYAGFAHTIAGDFDRGWAFVGQALTTARRIHNPLTLAFAHHIAANVQHMLGATSECARLSAESARIAEEHRLVFWQAVGDVMGGWACARQAGDAAGIERMRRGLHAWQASGAELHIPTWHAALADGLLAAGAIDEAGETVDRALVLADERQERFAIPVLLRLKGMVADRQGDARTGQTLLEQAIAVARQQGAGLYQLRAAWELAGLVMRRGDHATARRVLGEACDAVKGGASIGCVTQARRLLSSLAR
jgi:class 3 adenylate cyclase/tetratricopeptide (TPR) repeat protein